MPRIYLLFAYDVKSFWKGISKMFLNWLEVSLEVLHKKLFFLFYLSILPFILILALYITTRKGNNCICRKGHYLLQYNFAQWFCRVFDIILMSNSLKSIRTIQLIKSYDILILAWLYKCIFISTFDTRQLSSNISICSVSGQSLITRKAVSIDRVFMG